MHIRRTVSVAFLTMIALATLLAVAAPATASAAVQTLEVEYQQGDTPLKGFLAWNDASKSKRPGVLVVHEWWGENENTRNKARALAKAGYVAFALDMFGNGKTTAHPESAQAFVREATKDMAVMRARFDAALARLKEDPHVDPEKIAAIGYCFGGMVVIEAARSGADLDAVATLHGGFAPAQSADSGKITPKILILTGGADPMVPATEVESVRKDLTARGADVKVITYPGAKHGFTNPDADKFGIQGLGYDAEADRKSWAALLKFLKKTLK